MSRYYSDMVNMPTCVYRIYDGPGGDLLYIGLSMNIEGRIAKHRCSGWWPEHADITLQWFEGREAAKRAERNAIAEEHPIYNITRPTKITMRVID